MHICKLCQLSTNLHIRKISKITFLKEIRIGVSNQSRVSHYLWFNQYKEKTHLFSQVKFKIK